MGTSKGGTCAIYYGLELRAVHVFSGACQYYIGNYLNNDNDKPILRGMLGDDYTQKDLDELNKAVCKQFEKYKDNGTVIHLLYSEDEPTYPEHTVHLLRDLEKWGVPYTANVEHFTNHNDIGRFFIPYIRNEISKLM